MATLWDDIKKAVKDSYVTAAGKTGELTKIGRIKLEIIGVKHEINKKFSELGGLTYHILVEKKGMPVEGHLVITELVDSIGRLEAVLNEKEKLIEKIRREEKEKLTRRNAVI